MSDPYTLPWTEGIPGNFSIYAADGQGNHSGTVATILPCGDNEDRRQRLRLIVKAVNNHDKLVEMLYAATDSLEMHTKKAYPGHTNPFVTKARALLTELENST